MILRFASGLLLALAAIVGRAGEPFPVPPWHPTSIFVDDNGKWAPVFSATSDGRAIVKDGDRKRTIRGNPRLRFLRAGAYLPGFVHMKNPDHPEVLYGEGASLQMDATSDRLLTNCMAVMLTVEPKPAEYTHAVTRLAVLGIDDLKPGKPSHIVMQFPSKSLAGMSAVLLLFSNGREIRTDFCDTAAKLFHELELEEHRDVLMAYHKKFGAADHDAEPYLRFQPLFPDDVVVDSLPDEIHVNMIVNPDGIPEDLRMNEPLPRPAALAIYRTIGGWLYVPRLEHGLDVGAIKRVTLQLRAPKPPAAAPAASAAAK